MHQVADRLYLFAEFRCHCCINIRSPIVEQIFLVVRERVVDGECLAVNRGGVCWNWGGRGDRISGGVAQRCVVG